MDYGFILFYFFCQRTEISICLNNLHPAIKYMFEKANVTQSDHSQPSEASNFLDTEGFYPLVILNNYAQLPFTYNCTSKTL